MFELLIINDEMIIHPKDLGDFAFSVEQSFNSRYINKIISKEAGLCVAIKNIKILDKIVVQGEGSVQVKVI